MHLGVEVATCRRSRDCYNWYYADTGQPTDGAELFASECRVGRTDAEVDRSEWQVRSLEPLGGARPISGYFGGGQVRPVVVDGQIGLREPHFADGVESVLQRQLAEAER